MVKERRGSGYQVLTDLPLKCFTISALVYQALTRERAEALCQYL